MAEPRIYTKNYVNAESLYTVSHGGSSIGNIYDRDKVSQWSSISATGTTATIDIHFYEGTIEAYRIIDTLMLINHNLSAFNLYYYDEATSAFILWQAFTAITGTNYIATITSRTTRKIRLEMTLTEPAGLEKKIGELILCKLQLDLGKDLDAYDVTFRQRAKQITLGDGSLHQVLIYWAANRTQKYEARIRLNMIATALAASLLAIKETGIPFLWYPESENRPDEIWFVHWTNTWKYKYHSPYKGVGVDLEFELKEV